MTTQSPGAHGAFVVSLDFELHWGVRDHVTAQSPYWRNLLGAREAIPQILALFEEFDIAATWATVGMLFAKSAGERARYSPAVRPCYRNTTLDPYCETVGDNEAEDPLHYASSLISLIQRTAKQEIGCHTFSHYYCLEMGQSRQSFEADLSSAVSLARQRGIQLESIVLPRNQINRCYLDLLPKFGFTNYRGAEQGWIFDPLPSYSKSALRRAARFTDQYIPACGEKLLGWNEAAESNHLCNIRGSMFLRPFSPRLRALDRVRFGRIAASIRRAAVGGQIFHLWWHPHNFGLHTRENLEFLRSILAVVAECREKFGLRSLSMSKAAVIAKALRSHATADSAAKPVLV